MIRTKINARQRKILSIIDQLERADYAVIGALLEWPTTRQALYAAVNNLTKRKFLEESEALGELGGSKKVFSVTPFGKEILSRKTKQEIDQSLGIDIRKKV